ncbi:universal stress protein [Nocardiopsis sp. FIRDI 009]|uniref:universal stress protein n=1 Tax=Nocardiopsis sp. FIRDI 009 TaxID=714197 RepID=UPI000E25AB77|nr:universal stress protein [Nocardiopsis sp. FIRDI 009]
MARSANAPVVVAVNGTPASERAVDWAADEARLRGRGLRVVHAFDWPLYRALPRGLSGFDAYKFARHVVDDARRRALARVPGLAVDAAHITGDPEPVLLRESQKAHSLVLGAHRTTAVDVFLPDSTALDMLMFASCPLVVVPDRELPPPAGRVLVGVDGSATARTAATWAFEAADLRGAVLRAVTAHGETSRRRFGASERPPRVRVGESGEAAAGEEARRMMSESVAGERERWPGVRLEEVVAEGHPVEVLRAAAEDCDLMVVGSRGRGGFAGMLLGSVSRNVISHSPCPVAVVRTSRTASR